jgi:acetyl-CoA C-acetyltransferase
VLGNVIQAGNRMNPARQAAIGGDLPVSVPALTVNRVCGSGAQAILTAALEITASGSDAAIAGGMENMDRAPYLMDGGRWGYRMGPAQILGQHSDQHTEDLVTKFQLSREEQDAFAVRSQQRFAAARDAGRFTDEIVAVEIKGRTGPESFAMDEAPRPDTTVESLSRLKTAFRPGGTITAGNAPGLNSAGAAMIVAERGFANAKGIEPMARLAGYGVAAVESGLFGLGPAPAFRKALKKAGWTLGDIERIEINEAFAAVPIAVMRELGLPEDIVNVEGGAVAHRHAIGATGDILTTRFLHSMKRDGLSKGIATLCIGGGQGIALALEAL